ARLAEHSKRRLRHAFRQVVDYLVSADEGHDRSERQRRIEDQLCVGDCGLRGGRRREALRRWVCPEELTYESRLPSSGSANHEHGPVVVLWTGQRKDLVA